MADGGQHVVEFPALWVGVVDVVRDHARQPQLFGEKRGFRHEPVVVGKQVMLQFQEEAGRGRRLAAKQVPGEWPARP